MPLLVDNQQLTIINKLVRDGASNVASSFGALAGVDTTSQIRCLSFVDPEDLPDEMGSDETYVASVQLAEPPYGTVLLTFSPEAAEVVAKLVTGQSIKGDLSEIHQSGLQEMCNICMSGSITGWPTRSTGASTWEPRTCAVSTARRCYARNSLISGTRA